VFKAKIDRRDVMVVTSGLATTALAFACVWGAAAAGVQLMGYYVLLWHIIPIPAGAFAVGLIASVGYGAASYLTQRKVSGYLLSSILELLLVSYVIAQYLHYRSAVSGLGDEAVGFLTFFDRTTRAFAWNGGGGPIGELGYAIRALEIAGFVGGGLVVPAVLRKKPYCDRCRCYRHSKYVAFAPAFDDENAAHAHVQAILRAATAGTVDAIAQAVAVHGPLSSRRAAEDSTRWLSVSLVYCPNCADGALVARSHIRSPEAKGQLRTVTVGNVPLDPDLVEQLVRQRRHPAHPYR
jgi:hypothetical protein